MRVKVPKSKEVEFVHIMIHKRKGESFTGLKNNIFIISDRDYPLVKHLCKQDNSSGNEKK